jgi:hypothetical protein
MFLTLATYESEIWRVTVTDQPRQKVSDAPISTNSWVQLYVLVISIYVGS